MPDLNFLPKTAFLPANIDACALYRLFMPHLHTPGSMFLFRQDRLKMEDLQGYEVVVVQRQVTPENQKAMKILKEHGKKVVYDLDDNMWSLPSYNPAKKIFEQMQDGFAICAREASVLTVSTRGLKAAVQAAMPGLKCEILVTPNAIDFDIFYPTQLNRNDGKVLIGWAGSNTHSGDLDEACGVFPAVLEKHKHAWMEFVGMAPPEKLLAACNRVTHKGWIPVGEYPNRFANWAWDIALAPLQDNRFNKSKSCIKGLEAAAMRIPCLMSDVQPYRELCSLGGPELEWLLCGVPAQWKTKLDRLIADPLYRNYMGDLLYQTAKRFFDIQTVKDNWAYAVRSAMNA